MPVLCIALWLTPLFASVPVAMEVNKKEQQINQMCIDKFKTTEEIKNCKAILMKVGK